MNSERFYWCSGCGRWHDSAKQQVRHFAMHVSRSEPSASNFEGTAEDLQRFLMARKLRAQDAEAFESRIDAALTPPQDAGQ